MSKMAPIHPGEILREEFECRENCSDWIIKLVNGHEDVTPEHAKSLAEHFDTSAKFWLNLQAYYDEDMKNV